MIVICWVSVLFTITAVGFVPFGGPKKSAPNIIHSADYIFSFGPLRSARVFWEIRKLLSVWIHFQTNV